MMTTEDGEPPQDSGPAKLFAGLSFFYALVAVTLLLILKDFFRDDANRDAALLWMLVPIVSSFGTWLAVYAGMPPLRAWVWLGIVLTLFLCWIAVFSFGLVFLPVAVLMMVAVVSPWDTAPIRPAAIPATQPAVAMRSSLPGRQVGYWRRLLGDDGLESALFAVTLCFGWFIWFAIVARRGQTPAKSLVKVKVQDFQTGAVVSARRMWLREVVAKRLLPAGIGFIAFLATGSEEAWGAVGAIYLLAASLLVVTTDDRRTIWDYVAGTTVRLHD